jgi:hypothetical protein
MYALLLTIKNGVMKKVIFSWLFSMVFLAVASAQYANRTGYEGDNFSLEGAIELFKQSYSINDFERKLNTQDTWVNNLDLDWDGRIDYIRVEHRRQGNYHAIILSVPLGYYDVQDIAVIEIEKVGRRRAILQIVGDPDIYGEEVIVEPIFQNGYAYNGDYRYDNGNNGYVNVFYWSAVQHMLGRNYRVYVSPYRWHYYPTWWSPWRPFAWDIYRPRIVVYHRHYHVVHVHRVVHVHNFYKPYRVYSHNVLVRTNNVRVRHGKAAVHRKPVKQNTRYKEYVRASKDVAKQPRGAAGNNRVDNARKPEERAQTSTPRSTPRANERSQATRPETGRVSKEARKPSVDTKRSTPSRSDKAIGNTPSTKRTSAAASPRTNSSSSSANKSTPRSTPKASRPSSQPSRSTPKANRSSSQPSRSTPKASTSSSPKRSTPSASRSSSSRSSASRGTTNRSSKPAAKSSGSSRSSSSTKATRKTSSSSSRNKRG